MPRIIKTKTINSIIVEYLEYCSYKNLRLKTIKSYHQTLMLFAKYLEEELEITDIKKGQYKSRRGVFSFYKR